MRKGCIKSPCVSLECIIRIQFLWRKDQIYTRLCSKQTSKLSQLKNKKKWNLITITFLAVYLTVLAKLLSLFFKSVHALLFFLKRSLIDGCQTVTDAFKDFKSLFGSLLNHLYHYANENVSVKHLSLICIISIVTTIYLLKDFSFYRRYCRIYSPRSFGFFRKEFR